MAHGAEKFWGVSVRYADMEKILMEVVTNKTQLLVRAGATGAKIVLKG